MKIAPALCLCAALLPLSCADDDDAQGGRNDAGSSGGTRGGAGGKLAAGGTGGAASGGIPGSSGGHTSVDASFVDASVLDAGNDATADGRDGSADAGTDAAASRDAGPPPNLRINFKAKVGAEDFRCGESYAKVGSTKVTVQPLDFRFYVEKVWLVTATGDEVPVVFNERAPWQTRDVALLDFEERRGLCFSGDAATNATITGNVPIGDYRGIVFTVGVPESLNHDDPSSYPPPLASPGMAWSWLMGFRFLKAELQGPSATAGLGYAHPGTTSCSGSAKDGTVTCARSNRNRVKLDSFDAATNVVVVDVANIFAGSDLSTDTECHGAGATCTPIYAALGIDAATGKPASNQAVFRVE